MKFRLALVLVFAFLMIISLAACSAAKPSVSMEDVWGRPSPMFPTSGSIYMLIKNTGEAADTLLSGSSPACGSIEFHETVMKLDGSMGMNLIDKPLEIPAGGEVKLEPGGLHAMCIMKNEKFAPGNTIDLTLVFEKSGEQVVPVDLRAE